MQSREILSRIVRRGDRVLEMRSVADLDESPPPSIVLVDFDGWVYPLGQVALPDSVRAVIVSTTTDEAFLYAWQWMTVAHDFTSDENPDAPHPGEAAWLFTREPKGGLSGQGT